MFMRKSRDDPYYKELQVRIDEATEALKLESRTSNDIFRLRDRTKEALGLLEEKNRLFGLDLSSRLGLNVIKTQLKTLNVACNLASKGMKKPEISKITGLKTQDKG